MLHKGAVPHQSNPSTAAFLAAPPQKNVMKRAPFTLVEIMIVVAIIGLLAAIAIPSYLNARNTSRKNACINNLRQIDSAQQQVLLAPGSESVTAAQVQAYLKQTALFCPAGTGAMALYDLAAIPPVCPITVAGHVLP